MREQLESCTSSLKEAVEGFPWQSRASYGQWLAQTFYYVRHSTRLLAASAARFALGEPGDALHYRFAMHISEEKRHEQLALHDLKQLGLSIEQFTERHSTRMFYEPQYYKVEHEGPGVLFGYILALESFGPAFGPGVVEQVVRAFGDKVAAFLKLHADEDEDHIEKALAMIASVPERERELVLRNLAQTTYAYRALLADIAG